jgi:hypothetical protein
MSLTEIGFTLGALSGSGYLAASFTYRRKWARAAAIVTGSAIALIILDYVLPALPVADMTTRSSTSR